MPLHILIVDDNQAGREVTFEQVRLLGHHADMATDGAHALGAVNAVVYDVVIMDLKMPQMDGLEVAQRIRARGTAIRQPRIIAVTAGIRQDDRERCLAVGMDDYLPRPLRLAALRAALEGPPPAPADPTPVDIDRSVVTTLARNLGQPMLQRAAQTFALEAPGHIAALRTALAADNQAEIGRLAHLIRGRSLSLGANAVAAHCARLEERIATGQPSDPDSLVPLEAAYRAAARDICAHVRWLAG